MRDRRIMSTKHMQLRIDNRMDVNTIHILNLDLSSHRRLVRCPGLLSHKPSQWLIRYLRLSSILCLRYSGYHMNQPSSYCPILILPMQNSFRAILLGHSIVLDLDLVYQVRLTVNPCCIRQPILPLLLIILDPLLNSLPMP